MKKRSAFVLATVLLSASLFANDHSVAASSQKGTVVNAYTVNMRQASSNNGKIIAVLKKGATVEVLNGSGSWDYVKYGSKKGYIYDKYLNIAKTTASSTTNGTVVNAYMLNLRQSASANSKIVAVLNKGDKVSVLKKSGSWYQVIYNGKIGYAHSKYIKTSTSSTTSKPATVTTTTGTVTSYMLNVRASASSNSKIIAVLNKGNKVTITKKIGSWYVISINGKTGYVYGTYIKTGSTSISTPTPTKPTPPVTTPTKPTNPTPTPTPKPTPPPVTTPPVTTPPTSNSLKGKLIVVDPGHGDGRPGASYNGITEKFLTYDMSLRVKSYLQAKGAKVVLTRNSDADCRPGASLSVDLACRPALANSLGADAFISIHANAGSTSAKGAESFYYYNSGKKLAKSVLDGYVAETGLKYRRSDYQSLAVLRASRVPATLLEVGFLSNSSEASKLKQDSFKNKGALGITKGIEDFFGK